jgi:hypothetical protein
MIEMGQIVRKLENVATGDVRENLHVTQARAVIASWARKGVAQRDVKVVGVNKSDAIRGISFEGKLAQVRNMSEKEVGELVNA